MKTQRHFIYLLIATAITSWILSTIITQHGLFLDSATYYSQFNEIKKNGLIYFIINTHEKSGKIEPILPTIFFIQSFLIKDEQSFFFINFFIVNLLIISCPPKKNDSYAIIFILTAYTTFTYSIYIWRNIMALTLAIMATQQKKKTSKVFLFTAATLTHISALPYYLTMEYIKTMRPSTKSIIITSTLIGFALPFLLKENYLSAFISAQDTSEFTEKTQNTIYQIIYYTTLIYLTKSAKNFTNENEQYLIKFCILCIIISIPVSSSWQSMYRAIMPASIIATSLYIKNKKNFSTQAIFVVIALTMPTANLLTKIKETTQ